MATLESTHVLIILVSASINVCATNVNPCNKHCAIISDWSNWDCSGCLNNIGTASRYRSLCCFLKTKQECLTNCSMESSNIFQRDLCTNVCYISTPNPITSHLLPITTTSPSRVHAPPITTTKPSKVHVPPITTTKPSTVHAPPKTTTKLSTMLTPPKTTTKLSTVHALPSTTTKPSTVHAPQLTSTTMRQTSSHWYQTQVPSSRSVPSNTLSSSVLTSHVGSGLSTTYTRIIPLTSTTKPSTVHAPPTSTKVMPQISGTEHQTSSSSSSVKPNTYISPVPGPLSIVSTKTLPTAPMTKLTSSHVPSIWTTVMPQVSSTGQQTSVPVPKTQTVPSTRSSIQTGIHATQMTSTSLPTNIATTNTQGSAMVSAYLVTNAPASALSASSSPMATTNSDVTLEDTAIPNQSPSTNWSHNFIDSHTAGDYMDHIAEDTEAADRCGGILVSICLFLFGLVIGAVTVAIIYHCCCHGNTNKNKTNSTKHLHNQTYDVRSQSIMNKELFQSVNAISGFEYGSSRAKNIKQVSPVSSTGSLINPWSDMVENSPSGSPKYPSPVLGPNNPPSLGRHRGSYIIEKIPNSGSSSGSSSSSNNGDSHARVTID